MKTFKTIALFSMLISMTVANAAGSALEAKGKAIEAEMDSVTPNLDNRDLKIENQFNAIVEKVVKYIEDAGKLKNLSDDDLIEVSRVLVRGMQYDRQNDSADVASDALQKYIPRMEKIFRSLEKYKVADPDAFKRTRIYMGMDVGAAAPTPQKKKTSTAKKADDGAQLSPCDLGECKSPAALSSTAAKALKRLAI